MHGGASTGPRTAEGLARSRRARWKYGLYSAEARAEQKGWQRQRTEPPEGWRAVLACVLEEWSLFC